MKRGTSPVSIAEDLADNLRAALARIKLAQNEGMGDLFKAAMPDAEAALAAFDSYREVTAGEEQERFERAVLACIECVGDTLIGVREPNWRRLAELRHAIEAIERRAFSIPGPIRH